MAAWSPDVFTFAPADAVPDALILQCATQGGVDDGDAPSVRAAYVVDDHAQSSTQGAEAPDGEPTLAEVLVHSAKCTQLLPISREQWGQDGTAQQLSDSVRRAIIRRADLAFAAEAAPTPPAVAPVVGLVNTTNIVDGGTVNASLDILVDLIATLQDNLAIPSQIVLDPLGWAEFRKPKIGTAYNQSLLGARTTDATERLLSLPILVNVAMPNYTGLVIDQRAVVSAVGPVHVAVSEHAYFTSESVARLASWRFGHVVVRPERLGKFVIGGGS